MICHGIILVTRSADTPILNSFSGGITSSVSNMSGMFERAGADWDSSEYEVIHNHTLNLDTTCLDTSSVNYMNSMFSYTNPSSLILTNFDTSNVFNMNFMFSGIKSLNDSTFDISGFDTSKVTSMSGMFKYFYGVNTLDLSR